MTDKKESLLSKKNLKLIKDPLDDNNPITVQVLGICSALAITVQLKPAVVMALSTFFVMCTANVVVSLMRNMIPSRIRIIIQLVVIATLVILVDQILRAFAYDVSKELSIFIGLIITNCIVMGRADAFAMSNTPRDSILDGIGNGIGYGTILIIVSIVREILGTGQMYGYQLIPMSFYLENGGWYMNNGLMLLAPGAFIVLGLLIWAQRTYTGFVEE